MGHGDDGAGDVNVLRGIEASGVVLPISEDTLKENFSKVTAMSNETVQ